MGAGEGGGTLARRAALEVGCAPPGGPHVEVRAPFLDTVLVEYMQRLPSSYKYDGRMTKRLLKAASASRLPTSILQRPKKGFGIPVGKWIRGSLRDEFRDALHPGRIGAKGFLDPGAVSQLLDDHLAGRRDNRKQLWTLYMFERWHDKFAAGAASHGTGVRTA